MNQNEDKAIPFNNEKNVNGNTPDNDQGLNNPDTGDDMTPENQDLAGNIVTYPDWFQWRYPNDGNQGRAMVGVVERTARKDKGYMRIRGFRTNDKLQHLQIIADDLWIRGDLRKVNLRIDGGINLGGITDGGRPMEPKAGTIVLGDVLVNSSLSMKEQVQSLSSEEASNLIKNIEPVKFLYKQDEQKKENIGFIAENVPEIFTDASHKTVRFLEVVSAMTKVVQEQQKTIEEMKTEINDLKTKMNLNDRYDN
jgi:hypothetical protein